MTTVEGCFIRDAVADLMESGYTAEQLKTAEVRYDSGGAASQSAQSDASHADDVHLDTDADRATWTEVIQRFHPAQLRSSAQSVGIQRRRENIQKFEKKRSKLFDTAHDCNIKSGVEIVHKAVVHVDNLDVNSTPELLTDYLLSKDINVMSCFATKSWLKDDAE